MIRYSSSEVPITNDLTPVSMLQYFIKFRKLHLIPDRFGGEQISLIHSAGYHILKYAIAHMPLFEELNISSWGGELDFSMVMELVATLVHLRRVRVDGHIDDGEEPDIGPSYNESSYLRLQHLVSQSIEFDRSFEVVCYLKSTDRTLPFKIRLERDV